VRSLATRTQASTQEIRTMIERLQEAAHSASAAMSESHAGAGEAVRQSREALDTLLTITSAVQQVSEQNMQIASATEEQTAVAEDINRNIVETREMAEQTALDAEEMRSATGRIMTGLEQLNALLGKFRTN
jgi:methyl-accepting chemotaxis protein